MTVDIIGKRDTVPQPYRFQRHDVAPSVLLFYHVRIEEVTTVVVEAGDKPPLRIGVGRPAVLGGVMLDQLSGVVGDYLPVVVLPGGFIDIKAVFFALPIIVGTDTSCLCFLRI